jgi:hypothetical protein
MGPRLIDPSLVDHSLLPGAEGQVGLLHARGGFVWRSRGFPTNRVQHQPQPASFGLFQLSPDEVGLR